MPESNMPIKTDYTFSGEVSRGDVVPVVIVDLDTGLPASSGGGGGASTIADGADVAQGAKADAQATDATSSWSVIALLKGLYTRLGSISSNLLTAAKGATVAGSPTSRSKSADVTALDVQIVDASGVQITSFGGAASENHIGQVGGTSVIISPTVTVSTSPAYTSGDCVGGKITLTSAMRISGGSALLKSIFILDIDNQHPALDIFIFNSDPSAGTYTDNGALTLNATDQAKLIRRISINSTTDWVTAGGISTVNKNDLSDVLLASGSANLYAVINTTSTPVFSTTSSLSVRFGIIQN